MDFTASHWETGWIGTPHVLGLGRASALDCGRRLGRAGPSSLQSSRSWSPSAWLARIERRAGAGHCGCRVNGEHGCAPTLRTGCGMRVLILGSGRLGGVLGQRLVGARHEVVFAWGESAALRAGEKCPGARAAGCADAVLDADVVVLAVPFGAVAGVLAECGSLDGTLVWSCVNAVSPDGGGLVVGFDDSAAETVARLVPEARVVAALLPCADVMADPGLFGRVRPSSWVCGESRADRAVVAGLLESVGVEPIDAGGLDAARLVEPAMMLVHRQAIGVTPPRRLALRLVEHGWEQLDQSSSILT